MSSKKTNKYLPGGGINPIWVNEREVDHMTDNIMNTLKDILDNTSFDIGINLAEGVTLQLQNKPKKEMCSLIDGSMDLDSAFDFLRSHMHDPEELQLAKEILRMRYQSL